MGNLTKVKIIKNKVAPPFRSCEFNILYGKGIDKIGEVISAAKDFDILKRRAGIITFRGEKYPESDFALMLQDDGFYQEIYKQIENAINGVSVEEVTPTGEVID